MHMGLSKHNIIKYKYRTKVKRICFFLCIFIFFLVCMFVIAQLKTAFLKVFVPYAINIGSDSINYTVSEYFKDNNYDYQDFVTLEYNNDNEITSVRANSVLMNMVKADLSIYLQDKVNELKSTNITIPFGSVFNNPMFAGMGPDLSIKLKPTDITDLVFSDSFEACGINQVRHKIYIEVFINISIHFGTMSKTEIIEDTIPVAETVIVGRVPQYYGSDIIGMSNDEEEFVWRK